MSDPLDLNEEELLGERTTNSESQPPSRSESQSQARQDLVDTFHLFKNYMDHKIIDLKSDILSEQESFSKKYREDITLKFKSESNRIQFRFNEDILEGLQKLHKQLLVSSPSSATFAVELITKLKERNKHIRIAETSAGGWATVREYESSDIADNEEDDKKIRQAESRALKIIKEKKARPQPYPVTVRPPAPATATYASTATVPNYGAPFRYQQPFRHSVARREPCPWDMCHFCKQYGHWRKDCPLIPAKTPAASSQTNTPSKQ